MYTVEQASEIILSKLDENDLQMLYQILHSGNDVIFLKIVCKIIEQKYPGLASNMFAQFEEFEVVQNEFEKNMEKVKKVKYFKCNEYYKIGNGMIV